METIYLILIVILFVLALSDLIVGVSNDAVNFLNSAIGSKAAPFRVIMFIAGLGVLFGASFSGGMMEIARKGIFNPEMFYFNEIMIIFIAVMITDVILLDLFNTMGLPTSTTVSIVFELLGASVAITLMKILPGEDILNYINTSKAVAIIIGILLSVVIAFSVGAFIQYIVRIIFTFNYKKTLKYYGAIWGGIAITAITYFILIKGAKGSVFISESSYLWIQANSLQIVVISMFFWTLLFQTLSMLTKFNVLKVIVLIGTFALAMAFAGNDLVNFIGVPLAGYSAFQLFVESGLSHDAVTMEGLRDLVKTPTIILLASGVVMVLTLWFSKKAKKVVATTVDLSRQDNGDERFQSSSFSRALVHGSMKLSNVLNYIIPRTITEKIAMRFEPPDETQDDGSAFDLLRASVNLVVASVIISFATSLKLPLSTTYVTFMVAMGTSLSDKAWGRESAVYRISGVLVVIGGWFFTALIAFTVAFIIALLIHYLGYIAIIALIALAIFLVIHSHLLFTKKEKEEANIKSEQEINSELTNHENILLKCNRSIIANLSSIARIYYDTAISLTEENRILLKKTEKEMLQLRKTAKSIKANLYQTIHILEENDIENSHNYVQIVDYLRELTRSIRIIYEESSIHISNNHKAMTQEQQFELIILAQKLVELMFEVVEVIKSTNYTKYDDIVHLSEELLKNIEEDRINQVKRIKRESDNTKRSVLFLSILFETKSIVIDTMRVLKIQQRFVNNLGDKKNSI